MSNNKGFSVVEIALVVALVAVIGFVSWRVIDATGEETVEQPVTQSEEAEAVPEVNEAADLTEAEQYLNDVDVEGELDTSEVDDVLNQ